MTKKPPKDKPKNIGPAMHVLAQRQAEAELRASIVSMADEIFDRYVWGESFSGIAESLPFAVPGWKLRQVLMESEQTRETYANANILRAHNLVEASLDYGRMAAALGTESGLRVAIETNLKVAARLNAADYGDKARIEHTGAGGGPVKLLAMTDEELLRIAAQGAAESDQ